MSRTTQTAQWLLRSTPYAAQLLLRSTQHAAALMLIGATISAQGSAVGQASVVAGRVVRPVDNEFVPIRGHWVTLHRVGRDRAGPLDSVRTNREGRYELRYRRTGDSNAVYFAAAVYGGVAYFTPPLQAEVVRGEPAELVVFDTTSGKLRLIVRGRHLIISGAGAGASRPVMEVFELANDSSVTLVSPTEASAATWSARLPRAARDPRAAESDVPREAVSFGAGVVKVVSPMPPGVKQVAYSYVLPPGAFPLRVTLDDTTDVYEVLLEDPSGRARGAGLAEVEPVRVEGRRFRRFLAQNVPANAVAVIEIPRGRGGLRGGYVVALMVALGAAMAFALARALRRA